MANTSIDLIGLDFASLKTNLKEFLKTQTQFKDMDFEGSNINVFLDLLAYNTYLNAYYTNMVASEMFLDTAILRDSVVSHAKELNYVPRSFNSAKADVTVAITPATQVTSVVIPAYTTFTSRVGSNTFTFSTDDTIVITDSTNGVFSYVGNLYEGALVTEAFTVNQANAAQRFMISNRAVDLSSVSMTVYEDNGETTLTYKQVDNIYNLDETSQVYFTQGGQQGQYEIVFGDNVFGRKPKDGAVISLKYRVSSGELPNGARTFVSDAAIDGHTNVVVTTQSAAAGGAIYESIDSIKYNAPRNFQTQGRAVTEDDYETLLKAQFPDIQSVSAYGGETVSPPVYGKVFIAVDAQGSDGATDSQKKNYYDYIKTKTPVSIDVAFTKPEFLYLIISTSINYNVNVTKKTSSDIGALVQASVSDFNNTYLEKFKASMYHSQLLTAIDKADLSIISNDTQVFLSKRIAPITNTDYRVNFSLNNELEQETGVRLAEDEVHYGHSVTTSAFTYLGTRCIIIDDTLGNLYIAAEAAGTVSVLTQIGTVDYKKGTIDIPALNVSDYEGNSIVFKCRTLSKNILSNQNAILKIDDRDVSVTVTPVRA